MKLDGNAVRSGMIIKHQNTLWLVVKTNTVKPGKGGAYNQVELKNIIDGRKLNERFRASENVERVRLEQKECTYLYDAGNFLTFMDSETYEQIELQKDLVGEQLAYFTENLPVRIDFYEDKPVGITLPEQITLKVIETEPAIKGQTATNSFKPAILENGLRTNIPPFIAIGEKILISTEDGTYIKRAE